MLCERHNVNADAGDSRQLKDAAAVQMHRSHENFEMVLQEACIQHKTVDSMKKELGPTSTSRATDCSHSLHIAENAQRSNT